MRTLKLIGIFLIYSFVMFAFFYLGFDQGKKIGRQEQGEWIKVVDTTFHYEFKQKQ